MPALLSSVTTTLDDVQTYLLPLLSRMLTPILLGHSLDLDLKALKLCHPQCIDTALMYHHPCRQPMKPGLAWLTKKWLGGRYRPTGTGGTIRKKMRGRVWICSS
jgi:RNA exonuclease 1